MSYINNNRETINTNDASNSFALISTPLLRHSNFSNFGIHVIRNLRHRQVVCVDNISEINQTYTINTNSNIFDLSTESDNTNTSGSAVMFNNLKKI